MLLIFIFIYIYCCIKYNLDPRMWNSIGTCLIKMNSIATNTINDAILAYERAVSCNDTEGIAGKYIKLNCIFVKLLKMYSHVILFY